MPSNFKCCAGQPAERPLELSKQAAEVVHIQTFHRRKLAVPPAVPFSSLEGRAIFKEALAHGTLEGFFELVEQFSTQDEPAFCGLSSIAMVLNAMAVDPRRPWKGVWRWFHEYMLDCCRPIDQIKQDGINLPQAACLARCNGASVNMWRHGDESEDAFRDRVRASCSSTSMHMIVSYSRKGLLQTGDGHFSPVGGYHAQPDLVLVLDTARFKYPPHWVPLGLLYAAMAALDSSTSKPRGYLVLERLAQPDSVLFTLDIRDGCSAAALEFVQNGLQQLLHTSSRSNAAAAFSTVLDAVVNALPEQSAAKFVAVRGSNLGCAESSCRQQASEDQLLMELRATSLHQEVAARLDEQHCCTETTVSDHAAMLLLLSDWGPLEPLEAGNEIQSMLEISKMQIVEAEVQYLRRQLENLPGLANA
ncbi:hypothetical protein WJX84_008908 [Apatococcus fuscideae]|uniref:glutathione gamma-glutamylcysteinyltransferase n=1 Tax=Apatococcus fuscideae TaxID=2026836 RepID=A0AAW1RVX8_9CHLO